MLAVSLGRWFSEFEEYDPAIEGSGVPVYAAATGTVLETGPDGSGLGRVKIKLQDGSTGFYDHLDPEHILVETGDSVLNDTKIGYLEDDKKHLHLERRPGNGVIVTNPLPFFKPIIRNTFVNWNGGKNTSYDDEYEWQGDIWTDPLIQPSTGY